ncbi:MULTISPECIES: flagellar hook-associated protein FlgL [Halomonadaceae]|uniref:flagellar hook-associated protein FlgL n=1 Tax=Halomonadaceae TaxID=28256 RepID=UPI001599A08B|nr:MULTISPECIES: flagellar hook-associated protein FlgL [Halomonas]QJQ94409.1 flagellar hook-associated protein FlgL [Halomonas sp. PA5]
MRISTVTMFEQSASSMNRQQSEFLKISQQMATGRRVVNPSDDPQAASRALGVSQSIAVTQQYTDTRIMAKNTLSQTASVINSVTDGITSARTLIVQGNNGTLSNADRQSIASELDGIYQTMLGLANTTNGNGDYLFGGFKNDEPPFKMASVDDGPDFVEYQGDDNTQTLQVDPTRQMPVQENGAAIFGDVFTTLEKAIAALETPIVTPEDQEAFNEAMNSALREFDASLDNVLTIGASVGARLNELDVLDSVGNNRMLNYQQTRSDLVDLDYNKAISDYSMRQVGLQAAQQTFVGIQGLSLFNYM